jgi:RNA polymerase II subunit A-like phosphatase
MRRETLLKFPQVKIVFSGLIPVSKQNKQTQIRPHVVRYAEELGAEVLPGISNEVTHVVAARDRSEKICQARKQVPGCFIVHTSWLMECYWSITRRDVEPHHMGLLPPQLAKQDTVNGKSNGLHLGNSSREDSDEDDSEDGFVGDLEKEMLMQRK